MKRDDRDAPYFHPLIGNNSWGPPVRILQLIFAALVLALSAYTIDHIRGWKEARFAVATVTFNLMKLKIRVLGV